MAGPQSWIFTAEQINNTPSIKNGFTQEKESAVRQQAANLIQTMGQKMQLNQLCMNTAIVYMHRFYMLQSLQRFPYKRMASAFIFLAAKVEEQPKKIEHVIRTYFYLHHRDENGRPVEVDVRSQDYLERVQELVINENVLLQTLGFKVTIDHSNTHVVKLCQLVKAPKDLSQLSYFLSTNSLLLTNLCLQYSPQVIAATCINLACKWADWELQRSKEGKDWWHYLAPSLTSTQLEETSKLFLCVMEKADPKLKNQLVTQFKLSADSSPNSRSASPAPMMTPRSTHGSSHRPSSSAAHPHSHNYTPDKGSSRLATTSHDVPPAKTYAEHRERSRLAGDSSSKSRPQVESPLARTDLKRPYPKDSHHSTSHNSSNASHGSAHPPQPPAHSSGAGPYGSNPYAKQPRNHDSKSRHHHRHHPTSSSISASPVKKQRLTGENGNGEQKPPLPPQPPLPRHPPPH